MRKEEIKTEEEYFEDVIKYLGIGDTIKVVEGELGTDWEDDEIIEFRNSCGVLLSKYNRDKGIAIYI